MRIHLIAVGGAIMHNLALLLHSQGHQVTGSDDQIQDPSKTRLENAGLLPAQLGWFPEKITADLDLVILGMHAKEDNPELQEALKRGIQVMSFPEFLFNQSKDKHRIVVAGSHGKTTVSSMITHVLKGVHLPFDYLVGAQISGFERMVELSDAPTIVIEGDEYLTSPMDKKPKFLWYKPHILVITGIAWDHINVFPTFDQYLAAFDTLIAQLEKASMIVYNEDDVTLKNLVKKYAKREDLYFYPYSALASKKKGLQVEVKIENHSSIVKVFGKHNLSNMSAAWQVCQLLAISPAEFLTQMKTFTGAARRLQTVYEDKKNIVIRDFAHSPSKVAASLDAVVSHFGKNNVIACLELHTFSSLNKKFLQEYKKVLKGVNRKIVFVDNHTLALKNMPAITADDIHQAFDDKNIVFVDNLEKLEKALHDMKKQVVSWLDVKAQTNAWLGNKKDTNVWLMMSSGAFAGLDMQKFIQ